MEDVVKSTEFLNHTRSAISIPNLTSRLHYTEVGSTTSQPLCAARSRFYPLVYSHSVEKS